MQSNIVIHLHRVVIPDTTDLLTFHYIIHPKNTTLWMTAAPFVQLLHFQHLGTVMDNYVQKDNKMLWNQIIEPMDKAVVEEYPKNWDMYAWMINEAGLYNLLRKSRHPLADNYMDWILSRVIPNLRSKCQYTVVDLQKVFEIKWRVAILQNKIYALQKALNEEVEKSMQKDVKIYNLQGRVTKLTLLRDR